MTVSRSVVTDFSTANPLYVNAIVTFYTVVNGNKSNVKVTLYKNLTGDEVAANPQILDSQGKFKSPVYFQEPMIAEISGLGNVPTHQTGIINTPGNEAAVFATIAEAAAVQTAADVASAQAILDAINEIIVPDGAVFKSDYVGANSILLASTSLTPEPLIIAPSTLLGRSDTGDAAALTAAQVRTLLNVEDGATNDVVDTASVELAGAVMVTDYNANTVLAATLDNSPAPVTMGTETLLGRKSTGGIAALTAAEVRDVLNVAEGATASPGTQFAPTNKYSPLKMYEDDGYANGQPENGTAATHDASAGAVPSYTTAKKRSICVVTVAGTLADIALDVGDLLMALQDNPTTADHWAVISDCTSEFEDAIEAANGDLVELNGTYLLKNANPDDAINLIGEYTILNQCGYSAIYQTANNTRAALQTPRQCASAGLGVGQGLDVDDENGTKLQQVTYFQMSTVAHAADFPVGKKVEVFTDAIHPSEDGSSKGYISNAFIVVSVDYLTGVVYADRVIKYHNQIANASNIYLIPLHEDRPIKIREGALFMGAPTVIGGEVGWYLTLDGSNALTATISGSGSSRTLTILAGVPSYLISQGVRITLDSDSTWTGVITGTTATTITCTVSSSNDRGVSETAPTSGSVTIVPAFYCSEFDNTTHGGAIIVQQAHGSSIQCRFARLWAAGVRLRYSHFCTVDTFASKVVNIGTGISGKSWRLVYMIESYSSCRNEIRHKGSGGRHGYTSSSGSTSVAWAASHWQFRSGCSCENVVNIQTSGDTGAACDTHAMTNGDKITSEVEFVTSYNLAHSYRGIGGQLRGENHRIYHKQRGGQIGLRIANGSDYARAAGCIDEIDLDVCDLPMRSDGLPSGSSLPLSFQSNMPVGFIIQSQSGYTGGAAGEKTMFTGDFKFKNAGCGVSMEAATVGRLNTLSHKNVGFAQVYLQDANLFVGDVYGDYSLPNGVETNHTGGSVALATGSLSFTVGTGLTIPIGSQVLIQDSTSALTLRTAYGWGRVVSYNSGTGALTVFIHEKKGNATVTAWRVTIGAQQPRYGIVLKGASTFTATVVKWRVGEGANPTEIFHSVDHTGSKIVNVGILIIDDPLNKGMPSILTSGRESDFTVNIGIIIYNGKIVSGGAASPRAASRMAIQSDAGAGGTWTNMPLAETFLLGSARASRKVDLTGYSQVRIVGFVEAAGVSGAKLYPKYRATYDATVGNWTNLSAGACELILTNTGVYESAWVDIATAAKADVYLCIAGSGGDGAADPVVGNLTLEFR
jgi:hypothetical protein